MKTRTVLTLHAAGFAAITFVSAVAGAAEPSAPAPRSSTEAVQRFTLRNIVVQGNTLVSSPEIEAITREYLGRPVTFNDLSAMVARIGTLYADRGIVGNVFLPEQDDIENRLIVQVSESKLDAIKLTEQQKRRFPALTTPTLNSLALARNVSQAEEDLGSRPSVKIEADGDKLVPEISIDQQKPWLAYIGIDNTGNLATGRERLTFSYQNNEVLGVNKAYFVYQTSVQNPNDVQIYGTGLRIPFYETGDSLDLSLNYSKADQGNVGGLLSVNGSGWGLGGNWIHRWLSAPGEWRKSTALGLNMRWVINDVTMLETPLLGNMQTNTLTLQQDFSKEWGSHKVSASFSLNQNIPFGGNGDEEDLQLNRAATDVHYTFVRADANWQALFANGNALVAKVRAQWTPDALPSHEMFGVGGANSVRGFNEWELADDKGLLLSASYYFNGLHGEDYSVKPLVFADYGAVWRNHAEPGELTRNHISSIGFGTRVSAWKKFVGSADLGYVLDGQPQDPDGTAFLHVSAGVVF